MWMVHCHLDFHMEVGMGFVIKVGDVGNFPPEPLNWPKCSSFSNEKFTFNSSIIFKFDFLLAFILIIVNFFR